MGYYGLGPGSKVADKLSPLEQLLRSLPLEFALAALEVLEAITRSVVRQPQEEKHRRLLLASPDLAPLVGLPEGLEVLRGMGWQVEGEHVVLPSSVKFDFQGHVVKIIAAKEFVKKERENAKRSAKRAADMARVAEASNEKTSGADAKAASQATPTSQASAAALADAALKQAAAGGEAPPPAVAAAAPAALAEGPKEAEPATAPAPSGGPPGGLNMYELEMARRARAGGRQPAGAESDVRGPADREVCSCAVS